MFEVFVAVVIEELLPLLVGGYFRFAETREIRWWSVAAWICLGCSIGLFWCVPRLANPFVAGLAIGTGCFATFASVVCSASASVLHSRRESRQPSLSRPSVS
jgi:hypothetical protein